MRWPWSRWRRPARPPHPNGQAAADAEAAARRKLREAQAVRPEVDRAVSDFTAAVQRALRGAR